MVGHQLSDPYANPGRTGKLRESTEIESSLAQPSQFGHFPFPFPEGALGELRKCREPEWRKRLWETLSPRPPGIYRISAAPAEEGLFRRPRWR